MKPIALSLLSFSLMFGAAGASQAQWKPDHPVNIVVPWSAGGSTDQVTRIAAGELETLLNQKIVVVNTPGASGSIGTKSVMDAPKDGYTWLSGAAQDLGVYETLGMLKTNIKDWHVFLTVANVELLSVPANSPLKTAQDVIDAMKAKPGQVSVATAGVTSSGHSAMERIAAAAGVTYKEVAYDGGVPAVVATVSGETQVTPQLAVEQTDMILGKRLRPLAVIGDKPLELQGYGTIEPLSKTLPNLKSPTNYFGLFLPKGVPEDVVKTISAIWTDKISQSPGLKAYAAKRGSLFTPMQGAEAEKAIMPAVQTNAWAQFTAGKAKVSPDTVGIPKP
jgi:tripartite-type tricarboxylate transporter receptor subunit TctC